MLTLPISAHSWRPLHNALVQWMRDIITGSREGLAMQERYEALSRLSERELSRRGLTRADIPRLAVDIER